MKSQIFIEKNNASKKFNILHSQNEENKLFISKKTFENERFSS